MCVLLAATSQLGVSSKEHWPTAVTPPAPPQYVDGPLLTALLLLLVCFLEVAAGLSRWSLCCLYGCGQ